MLSYEVTITFIFRVLNFAVLIGILTYLINKYVVASIRRAIAYRRSRLAHIEQQYAELHKKEIDLERDMQQQSELRRELLKKVVVWKNKVDQYDEQLKIEAAQSADVMAQQMEQQKKALEDAELQKVVMPIALTHAEKKLRERFSDASHGEQYVHTVIKSLERM